MRIQKLLTIEDAFVIEGRGAMLIPYIEQSDFGDGKVETFVLLRKPDGTESRVFARFTAQHARQPDRIAFMCIIPGVRKEDVPLGSDICRFVDSDEKA
jgi:hypothetical protein